MAIAEDVAMLLADSGQFGSLGNPIYAYEWGESNRQILVMLSTETPSDLRTLYATDAVQILVRGAKTESAAWAYQTSNEIYNFMVQLLNDTEINGNCYKSFEPNSNIAHLGKDENERHLFSLNFGTFRGLN